MKFLEIERFGITDRQKLAAFAARFYQGMQWSPKVGDYYTMSRADNQLCRIVGEDEKNFYITISWLDGKKSTHDPTPFGKSTFNTEGFGLNRVWCPEWIFEIPDQLRAAPATPTLRLPENMKEDSSFKNVRWLAPGWNACLDEVRRMNADLLGPGEK